MSHTPGPWTYETHDMGYNGPHGTFYTVRDKPGYQIVTVENFDAHIDPDNEDNARLIAAAPELLAALEIADHALGAVGFQDVQPIRSAIRAAIAKAKGT